MHLRLVRFDRLHNRIFIYVSHGKLSKKSLKRHLEKSLCLPLFLLRIGKMMIML